MEWFKKILVFLGVLAETAAEVGPIVGAGKAQGDLDKAAAVAKAAQKLGDAAEGLKKD